MQQPQHMSHMQTMQQIPSVQPIQNIQHIQHTIVDYVWIGEDGDLKSKTKIFYKIIERVDELPVFSYDSILSNSPESSEIFVYPKRLFRCPFRRPYGAIVMCDTHNSKNTLVDNHRHRAKKIFSTFADQKPYFGLTQMFSIATIGIDDNQENKNELSDKYCSVGAQNVIGRDISEDHLEACMYAGINVSGTNVGKHLGEWEFHLHPSEGLDAADQLWIARYILEKTAEKYHTQIIYDAHPDAKCYVSFSTQSMREEGGLNVIMSTIEKLKIKHREHLKYYGCDTSKFDEFNCAIGNRKASIRVPTNTYKNKRGCLEDRRPPANMNPYLVMTKLLESSI